MSGFNSFDDIIAVIPNIDDILKTERKLEALFTHTEKVWRAVKQSATINFATPQDKFNFITLLEIQPIDYSIVDRISNELVNSRIKLVLKTRYESTPVELKDRIDYVTSNVELMRWCWEAHKKTHVPIEQIVANETLRYKYPFVTYISNKYNKNGKEVIDPFAECGDGVVYSETTYRRVYERGEEAVQRKLKYSLMAILDFFNFTTDFKVEKIDEEDFPLIEYIAVKTVAANKPNPYRNYEFVGKSKYKTSTRVYSKEKYVEIHKGNNHKDFDIDLDRQLWFIRNHTNQWIE